MRNFLWLFLLLLLSPLSAEPLEKEKVQKILPAFEAYVEQARKDWEVPSVAVAVVHGEEILWWKGFGAAPPDLETVFAIGSTTKAFAAATLALMVDGGGPGWDAKVVDHVRDFAMYDPWVTREMQVDDLLAQHSGLPPQALSGLGAMGYSRDRIKQALRWAKPVSSFRSRYAYVNSPHLVAGELVAQWAGADSWEQVLDEKLLKPLGMTSTTWIAEGLDLNPNSAPGHARVNGKVKQISTGPFPYVFGPAGGLNSNLHDMSRWVRLQLHNGEFDGKRLISEENLRVTRTPHTVLSDTAFYCLGWLRIESNGQPITWHNGGTPGHTTFVGILPETKLGVVILSNLGGTQMPDAVGLRFFDMVRGFDAPDYNQVFLEKRPSPAEPRPKSGSFLAEMSGRYHHPALGLIQVDEKGTMTFSEPKLAARLDPIGPNLFEVRAKSGWLVDIGWDLLGEALYAPAGLSEPASFTIYLGDQGQGVSYRAEALATVP